MTPEPLAGKPQPHETSKAILACNDYLRMGAGRSIEKLHNRYQTVTEPSPPTRRLPTLKGWSSRYGWVARANAYDAEIEQRKTAAIDEQRREVMETGLALAHERVDELKRLATLLQSQILQTDDDHNEDDPRHRPNLWLRNVKQIGMGEFAEVVEYFRYNTAIIGDYRGVLDDLAKETGGRKTRAEVVGIDLDYSQLPLAALERIAEGEDVMAVLIDLASQAVANGS